MKNAVVWQSPAEDREGVGFVCEKGWDQPILDASQVKDCVRHFKHIIEFNPPNNYVRWV